MNERTLKRLSRAQLLELLLAQSREVDQLRQQLQQTTDRLEERQLRLTDVGDMTRAMETIRIMMEAAQRSARQYLEDRQAMEAETECRCRQLLNDARQEAELLRCG